MKKKKNNIPQSNQVSQSHSIFMWFITVGMLLVAIGTVMPLFAQDMTNETFKYVYGVGAALLLIGRLFSGYKGDNIRLKRLYRIESWSAIFFCVAVFFMFYERAGARDWLAFTLAGGAIQVYTSLMIPRTIAKENKH